MFKTIYPIKDTTLYSQFIEQNFGVDQILEISKKAIGSPSIENNESVFWAATYNSRILIQFDLTQISSSINNGKITGDALYYLTLKSTDSINLPTEYSIYAYPVSESWSNGRGFANNNPQITDGVSWRYRDSKLTGTLWTTSSYGPNTTGSFQTIAHGGTWFTSSAASQSFSLSDPDIRMDVTSIVHQWLSGSITNNGFILKLSDEVEQDTSEFGSIKFFSRETHTIFIPRLEVYWNDNDLSGTGSFTEIGSDDFVLYLKNLRESYSDSEIPKVRIGVRDRYPTQTYSTSSNYLNSNILPTSSYFQIQDVVTDDVIIPFHPSGTKINCDTNGNWFKADMSSLLPERVYKFVFKAEFDGSDTIRTIDDNYIFKVKRN